MKVRKEEIRKGKMISETGKGKESIKDKTCYMKDCEEGKKGIK